MTIAIKCQFKELVDPTNLVPNPKNPNKHSTKQIGLLAKLINHQGWRHPIIVSNRSGFVCAGHGRLEAAIKEGFEQVPVDYQDFENEAEEYQFMVSDNTIQELAELDFAMVNQDVLDFGPDFDLEMLGLPNFTLLPEVSDLDAAKSLVGDVDKKYRIEVEFPNDMEMMDIHDDLTNRGYLVKVL